MLEILKYVKNSLHWSSLGDYAIICKKKWVTLTPGWWKRKKKIELIWKNIFIPGADALKISGLLNSEKLGNFKNPIL